MKAEISNSFYEAIEDVFTHLEAWEDAIIRARDYSVAHDSDGYTYLDHQFDSFRRVAKVFREEFPLLKQSYEKGDTVSYNEEKYRSALEYIGKRSTELNDGSEYTRGWNAAVWNCRNVAKSTLGDLSDEDILDEEARIDALLLKLFRSNKEEDRSTYYLALNKWFQDRHYRRMENEKATKFEPKLKPLVWEKSPHHRNEWYGRSQFVTYQIINEVRDDGSHFKCVRIFCRGDIENITLGLATVKEAKAYAEKDYAKRGLELFHEMFDVVETEDP